MGSEIADSINSSKAQRSDFCRFAMVKVFLSYSISFSTVASDFGVVYLSFSQGGVIAMKSSCLRDLLAPLNS